MSLNPTLTVTKRGKKVIRCRKTRGGDWNYLTLDEYGFLWACVIGKHPWETIKTHYMYKALKTCYYNCTNLEILK